MRRTPSERAPGNHAYGAYAHKYLPPQRQTSDQCANYPMDTAIQRGYTFLLLKGRDHLHRKYPPRATFLAMIFLWRYGQISCAYVLPNIPQGRKLCTWQFFDTTVYFLYEI